MKHDDYESWADDAYDRWRDEQMFKEEEEKAKIKKRFTEPLDFINLPPKKFNKYCDERLQ